MTDIESPYNFVLMIPQSDTERLLEEHIATFGLKAERRVELKQFTRAPTECHAHSCIPMAGKRP